MTPDPDELVDACEELTEPQKSRLLRTVMLAAITEGQDQRRRALRWRAVAGIALLACALALAAAYRAATRHRDPCAYRVPNEAPPLHLTPGL